MAWSRTRLRTASFELGSSVVVSEPSLGLGFLRLTVDCVPCRTTEAIRGQDLYESSFFTQPFHPFLISAVGEGFVRFVCFLTLSWPCHVRYTEDRLVLHLIMPLDRLIVESGPNPECEYYSRGDARETEGFVIASESDNVRDHAEDRIVVHEEGIGLPALKSGHLLDDR